MISGRRVRLYSTGLIMGSVLVFLILNQKDSKCSYLPNERVLAETSTKELQITPAFKAQLQAHQWDEGFVRDSLLVKGTIDFNRSEPRKEPCASYLLYYPQKKYRYEIIFEKCKDKAVFIDLKKTQP